MFMHVFNALLMDCQQGIFSCRITWGGTLFCMGWWDGSEHLGDGAGIIALEDEDIRDRVISRLLELK